MGNFDLKKYLAEGRLYETIDLEIDDDIAILYADSGEYEADIEDFLGKDHAFVELAKKYDHNWDIERDLVGITIKLK